MSASTMTTLIESKADNTGLNQYKAGIMEAGAATATAGRAMTVATTEASMGFGMMRQNMMSLGIGEFVDRFIGASGVLRSTNGTLTGIQYGVHELSRSMLFVLPTFALTAMGLNAIIAVGDKLINKFAGIDDALMKNVKAQVEGVKIREEAVKTLQNLGIVDAQVTNDLLSSSKKRRDAAIAELRAKAEQLKQELGTQQQMVQAQREMNATANEMANPKSGAIDYNTLTYARQASAAVAGELTDKEKQLATIEDMLGKLAQEEAPLVEKTKAAHMDKWQILTKEVQAETKLREEKKKDAQNMVIDIARAQDMINLETQNMELTKKILVEKDAAKKKEMQDHIAYNNAMIASDQQLVSAEDANYKQIAAQITKYTTQFSDAWTYSNKMIKFNYDKFLSGIIGDVATAFTSVLEMEAAKDIGTGNLAQAAVAIGEITAIKTAASIASAYLGGGSGSAVSSGHAATSTSTAPTRSTNVVVNFQGASLGDPGAVAVIMKGISKQVIQNNGQVVTTQVVGNATPPAGMLA